MFSSNQITIQVCLLILLYLYRTEGAPTRDIDDDKVKLIFRTLRDKCVEKRDAFNQHVQDNYSTPRELNQTLCIIVLSAPEINSNVFPDNRLGDIIRNNKAKGDDKKVYGEKFHGEMKAIRDDISEKVDEFGNESGIPFVLVYSYYIPCARVNNVRYSCAEELSNYARLNSGAFNMLVGYTDVYNETDLQLASDYLHQRGTLYGLYDMKGETLEWEHGPSFFEPKSEVFQVKLHRCIMRTVGFESGAQAIKEKLVRDKIDKLIKECTQHSTRRGPITHKLMWELEQCFNESKQWVKFSSSELVSKVASRDCFVELIENSYMDGRTNLVFGIPQHGDEDPHWEEGTLREHWNTLYRDYTINENQVDLPKASITRQGLYTSRPLSGYIKTLNNKYAVQKNNYFKYHQRDGQ